MKKNVLIHVVLILMYGFNSVAQTLVTSQDFSLTSPFNEPDGRSDYAKLPNNEFVTLSKTKGNITGKSDFVMEKYTQDMKVQWKTPLQVESFEDYKDLFYNGKEIVLLSVIHMEKEKKTKLEAYGFDIVSGAKTWTKELENYTVGDWENHPHKGKTKETFIDIVCEHVNANFVTPIEYKHNISFAPNGEKFISYVYNYGEKNLTASVCVYDKTCTLIGKSKVSVDENFTNHGLFINNVGNLFIVNANNFGRVNVIRLDMATKDFQIIEIPGGNNLKDDLHLQFLSEDIVYVGCTEWNDSRLVGIRYAKLDFAKGVMVKNYFESINSSFASKVIEGKKNYKLNKGEEDWKEYDMAYFIVDQNENVQFALEKRMLYADGYPHIAKDVFDIAHKVEINGHVQAEGIILASFSKEDKLKWSYYIPKNQIYPASDGLNTISFVADYSMAGQIRILYASSDNLDGGVSNLNYLSLDKNTGAKVLDAKLPNENKLLLVKDYTIFTQDAIIVVGRKGALGKASSINKYKIP